jgi:hypothetical protein
VFVIQLHTSIQIITNVDNAYRSIHLAYPVLMTQLIMKEIAQIVELEILYLQMEENAL